MNTKLALVLLGLVFLVGCMSAESRRQEAERPAKYKEWDGRMRADWDEYNALKAQPSPPPPRITEDELNARAKAARELEDSYSDEVKNRATLYQMQDMARGREMLSREDYLRLAQAENDLIDLKVKTDLMIEKMKFERRMREEQEWRKAHPD